MDVTELLARAAGRPNRELDLDRIAARSDALARRRRVAWAVPTVVGSVVLISVAVAVLSQPDRDVVSLVVPPAGEVSGQFLPDGTPVWVVHPDNGEVRVLRAQGEAMHDWAVLWCPTGGWFESIWGSTFGLDGRVKGGPSRFGLASYEVVELGDGRIGVASTDAGTPTEERAEAPSNAGLRGCWYESDLEVNAVFHPAWEDLRTKEASG